MEQTFADNVRERRASGGHLLAFLVWTFAETSVGVMRERVRWAKAIAVAALVGLVLVLPLASMEWATQSDLPRSRFHVIWFVYLWLLVILFVLTSRGAVRTALAMRSGQVAVSQTVSLVALVALLAWLAWMWLTMVIDQWPCFLGATGC
jgi:hypothetical protein